MPPNREQTARFKTNSNMYQFRHTENVSDLDLDPVTLVPNIGIMVTYFYTNNKVNNSNGSNALAWKH